jgi:DNA-directed RNA polymerase specialized sigma24 family protein
MVFDSALEEKLATLEDVREIVSNLERWFRSRYGQEDSEDLAASVYHEMCSKVVGLPKSQMKKKMYRAARFHAARHNRSKSMQPSTAPWSDKAESTPSKEPGIDCALISELERENIDDCIRSLKPIYVLLIKAVYFEGWTHLETKSRYGVGNVGNMLERAYKQLRKCLESKGLNLVKS